MRLFLTLLMTGRHRRPQSPLPCCLLATLLTTCGAVGSGSGEATTSADGPSATYLAGECDQGYTDDPMVELAGVQIGDRVTAPPALANPAARMAALGFVANDEIPVTYTRVAPLHFVEPLVPTTLPALPGIDAIAIISIDRRSQTKPYIYQTLQSIFATFPDGIEVNVLVGNDRPQYLDEAHLNASLGPKHATHVHVWPTDTSNAAFLEARHGVHARAAWNYGRALRSYDGQRGLLVMEDDIVWARGAVVSLNHWLQQEHPPAMSLYNYFCQRLPSHAIVSKNILGAKLLSLPARTLPWTFARTQAMYYDASIAQSLGNYIAWRLGDAPFDHLVDFFLRHHAMSIGFTEPSMVQHIGFQTTGLGKFHESRCFFINYLKA